LKIYLRHQFESERASQAGVSSVDGESGRCLHDVEKRNLQLRGDVCFLQHEIANLHGGNSSPAPENGAQKQKMDALHKPDHELVARFAQPPSRSDDEI
jgi:hypothetical protein